MEVKYIEWTSPYGEIRNIFENAIKLWGEEAQLKMVAEECSELIKTVLKLSRKHNGSTIDEVIEEMADVYVMLGQLEIVLESIVGGSVNKKLEEMFLSKMEKLKSLIRLYKEPIKCPVCEDGGFEKYKKGKVVGYNQMWMCDKHYEEYEELIG